jgi:tripartite-type tricarboxylate transporter receptor subunit TctC
MSRTLGQTVVVENVGGAGGTIGMARVVKAAPDGYTTAVWHVGQASAPALYDGLKYDVVNDFDHLGRITDVPMTLVSKTPFPANNVTELLAWIRSQGDKASYGHAGIGSASHLCALVLMKELRVQMHGVAYRGTGPNDLLSGQFDVMCDQTTNTTNHINSGKIKGYTVTTKSKVPSVPDLPTLDSGAIPGFDVSAWHAKVCPKTFPINSWQRCRWRSRIRK